MERVVRVDRQPRRLHRRHLHGLRLHAQRERPRSSTTATTPDVVDPATYQTDVYSPEGGRLHPPPGAEPQALLPLRRPARPARRGGARATARATTRAPRRATRAGSPALTAPRDPSFNEADVSDKPANIKNLPPLEPDRRSANVDARYRARAEAVLGVDDLVQNVVSTLKQRASSRTPCSSSPRTTASSTVSTASRREGAPLRALDPGAAADPGARACRRGSTGASRSGTSTWRRRSSTSRTRRPGARRTGMSLVPIMQEQARLRPGRAMDWRPTSTPDTTEDPEDPPLNYRACARTATSTPLRHRRAGALRPANRPVRAPEPGGQSGLRAGAGARSQRLLGVLSELRRQDLPGAAGGEAEGARCSSAKVAGRGKPQEATFYLRGKKVRLDAKAPIRVGLPQPGLRRQAGGGGDLARRADRHARSGRSTADQPTGGRLPGKARDQLGEPLGLVLRDEGVGVLDPLERRAVDRLGEPLREGDLEEAVLHRPGEQRRPIEARAASPRPRSCSGDRSRAGP